MSSVSAGVPVWSPTDQECSSSCRGQPRGRTLLSCCGAKCQPAACQATALTLQPYHNQAGSWPAQYLFRCEPQFPTSHAAVRAPGLFLGDLEPAPATPRALAPSWGVSCTARRWAQLHPRLVLTQETTTPKGSKRKDPEVPPCVTAAGAGWTQPAAELKPQMGSWVTWLHPPPLHEPEVLCFSNAISGFFPETQV